jgi:exonuclease VII small subunit
MNDSYPDPTPEMLDGDPLFEAIWQAIKGWDISRRNDGLYSGPTGNDARHIYDAISAALDKANRIEALEDRIDELEQAKQEWTEAGEIMHDRIEALEAALRKIADLIDSEAGEPLDDAIAIARAALDKDAVE